MSPEEDWTQDAVDSEPKHYQLSYSGLLDTTVTLNKGQAHLNWHVELSGLYHHTKFERNQSVNTWVQANVKVFINQITQVGFSSLNIE